MKIFLIVLIVISMVSVLGVLMAGVILMGRGGEANDRWGNRLMRARVGLQLLAVVLLMLLFLVYRQ